MRENSADNWHMWAKLFDFIDGNDDRSFFESDEYEALLDVAKKNGFDYEIESEDACEQMSGLGGGHL